MRNRKTNPLSKRSFALLLTMVMLFGNLGIPAFANTGEILPTSSEAVVNETLPASDETALEETLPATEATAVTELTVYMTISVENAIQLGKDETTGIARIPLTIVKENPTAFDAIAQAHALYYEDGENGYTANSNGFFTKLWGKESTNCGYFVNGAMPFVASNQYALKDGDEIEAMIYADYSKDVYTRFHTQEVTVEEDEFFDLTLLGIGIMPAMSGAQPTEPVTDAKILTDDGTNHNIPNNSDWGWTTDHTGKVSLSFPTAGAYSVSATNADHSLIPTICTVTVIPGSSDGDKEKQVAQDTVALKLNAEGSLSLTANENLVLPTKGESGKTTIVWSSDNPNSVTNTGKVLKGSSEKTALLTATIQLGSVSQTKTFTITVPARTLEEAQSAISAAKAMLSSQKFKPSEFDGGGYGENFLDKNLIAMAQKQLEESTSTTGILISSLEIDETSGDSFKESLTTDGSITYPASGTTAKRTGKVHFLLEIPHMQGIIKDTCASSSILIDRHTQTKQEIIDADFATIDFNKIKQSNTTSSAVKTDLKLPTTGDSYYTSIQWVSDNPTVISTFGTVKRPLLGQPAVVVTLTATVKIASGMEPYVPGPNATEKITSIVVTVPAITQEDVDASAIEVNKAMEKMTEGGIKLIGEKTPVSLDQITYDLSLPSASGKISTLWSSENAGIQVNTYRGKLSRPAVGQPNVSGKLTVALSKDGYTTTKAFDTTVLAVTQEELEKETAFFNKVVEDLAFDVIKKDNVTSTAVTSNLQMVYRGLAQEDGTIKWATSNTGEVGIKIEFSSTNDSVITSYGTVTRPTQDKKVSMIATLSSIRLGDFVPSQTKAIPLVIKGTETYLPLLFMDNIAESYQDSAMDWVVMDMSAYQDLYPHTTNCITATAIETYINKTIETVANEKASISDLSKGIITLKSLGIDAQQLTTVNKTKVNAVEKLKQKTVTSIFEAPWALIAYQQGEYAVPESTISSLIQFIKNTQQENGGFGYSYGGATFEDPDTTATVLAALAPYYSASSDFPEVREIVDKAVDNLSVTQNDDGSYGQNANSTALAILGLSAIGIDFYTDSRFIKSENTLVDGLLLQGTETNDGFKFADTVNALATEQGFRGLIAAEKFKQSRVAYNLYDFSKNASNPAFATGSGSDGGSNPPTTPGENDPFITVNFTLKGDTSHGSTGHKSYETWISQKSIKLKPNATVRDAFILALEERGLAYDTAGTKKGYVEWITSPSGNMLTALDNGPLSGWLYSVNNKHPYQSFGDFTLKDQDTVLFHYTDDYTKEEGSEQWAGGSSSETAKPTTTITATVDKNGTATAIVGTKELALMAKNKNALKIQSSVAEIILDSDTVATLSKDASGDLKIVAAPVPPEKLNKNYPAEIGNRPVFAFSITLGNKNITSFSGKITISIPYEKTSTEETNALLVYYLDKDGKESLVQNGCYDEKAKAMKFSTNHFSTYAIGYHPINFIDISGHWASDSIAYLAARNIVSGKQGTQFKPNDTITRAEFVTILANKSGADLSTYSTSQFSDVKKDQWYYGAVSWASAQGIVKGIQKSDGSLVFNPNGNITREDMAVILDTFEKNVEKTTLPEKNKAIVFQDASKMFPYAKEPIATMQKSGIINGIKSADGTYNFNPKGSATRGEASKMIAEVIKSTL